MPRKTELERVVSSKGSVQTRDIEGPARIRTSNGAVRANNTRGALEVETSNGSIDVNDHTGAITGHTSNGRVQVDLSNPEQGRPIRLESSNGGITLRMRVTERQQRAALDFERLDQPRAAGERGRATAREHVKRPRTKRSAGSGQDREESCRREDRGRRTRTWS